MILAVDVGNSTVGFGFLDKDRIAHRFRAETRIRTTPDEYLSFLLSNMERAGVSSGDIEGSVMASAVPPLVPTIYETLKGVSGSTPLVVSPRLKLGIRITYKTPETLGIDRVVCGSAAYMLFGGPCMVVDCGTATTFTYIDHDGNLVGGAIAPGVQTSSEALMGRTACLPRVSLTFPKNAMGTTTDEAMLSGVVFGHAAMIEGMLKRFSDELGLKPVVVMTGGSAPAVTPHIKGVDRHEPDLSFKGLKAIFDKNK
jgi:type III pantothenate kinase